ncbi:MAG: alkaline phosphatase family protein [Candidatus Poribacteria bacterium]|nr:alkaline phosphatase family protein [Candidatus Poribacteria bacterium]
MAKKICAFGMDGFVVPMMKKFAAEGCLPNFERMLKAGTVNQTAPSFPVWTPTNWATLSTGAHTGTHGVSRWHVEVEPGKRINSFDGRASNAERIWNALERAGLKGVAVHYPAAAPSGVKTGFVVDGFGHPGYASTDYEIAACQAYTTREDVATVEMDHDGTAVRRAQQSIMPIPPLTSAEGWDNLPPSRSAPLESTIEVHARIGGDVNTFHLLVLDSHGNGYDRVQICSRKDGSSRITEAELGQWSEWAIEAFRIDGREQRASVRFKLMELDPNGEHLKLYRSQVTYADGFTYPDDLAPDLISRFGPYQEHASMTPYTSGMTDFDTALEECEYQGIWVADVANYMLHERDCSFFICHWHLYDYLNHIHLNDVDPACPGYTPENADEAMDYFRRAYQVGDRILGRIWEAADAETYVGTLGDHGAFPDIRIANIRKFLHERGFTVLTNGAEGVEQDEVLEKDIDWEKTQAYLKDDKGFDIFINAEPGPEFDKIERELLLALRTWVDEEVGGTPVAIALPKRDAYLLGQWGDQCGDVVFAWDHGYVSGYYGQWKRIVGGGTVGAPEVFGAHHGGFLPTQNDLSSSFGSMLLAGPDIKKGYERPAETLGYIHAADVVPTFCHLLGVLPPAQSQGAIAYDLLEGHEMVRQRES